MKTTTYAYDWAFKEKKNIFFDGKKVLKKVTPVKGDVILCENPPRRIANPWLKEGVRILRCRPNDTAGVRDAEGIEKTDENDVKIIWNLYKDNPHLFREWKGDPKLLIMYSSFKELQKVRIAQGQRLWAAGGKVDVIEEVTKDLEKTEKNLLKGIKKELDNYPIWTDFLCDVRGISTATGGGLIAMIDKLGIENIPSVASLWHYFGLHVENGNAPKLAKGKALTYSPKGKSLALGIIADCLMRSKGDYKKIYDSEKKRQLKKEYPIGELKEKFNKYKKYKDEDINVSLNHAHNRAKRKMVKSLFKDLWVAWRKLEKQEVTKPYESN